MKTFFTLLLACIPFFSFGQNGLNFDGVNDYVQTPFPGISGANARTVEAWIRTTVDAIASQQIITDWGTNATGGRFTFCVLWNNAIRIEVNGNGLSGTIPVNDGNWHHVAGVYDPSNASQPVRLYVDGVLDVGGTLTVAVNTGNSVGLRIGRRIDDAKNFLGDIDEVRVWNVARSVTDLQNSMNAEICNYTANLVAYYRFNQGVAGGTNSTQSLLNDFAQNNHGALQNFNLSGSSSNYISGPSLTPGYVRVNQSATACNSYLWTVNGQTYTSSGTHSATLLGANGCDSIVRLSLTISNSPANLTTNASACDQYFWSVSGVTYTSSINIDTIRYSSAGCPYHHYFNLTINDSYSNSETQVACNSFFWQPTGLTYNSSGTYTKSLSTISGCDSILTLNLTINTTDVQVTHQGNATLVGSSGFSNYQWIDCQNNQAIVGANQPTFTPSINGSYALVATLNGCTDTSDCVVVADVGISELNSESISVFPNPSFGKIFVSGAEDGLLRLYDMSARWVGDYLLPSPDISLRKGMYWVEFISESKIIYRQKVIVN